jgi:hypothetical protein
MEKDKDQIIANKLDTLIELSQRLLALELFKSGATKVTIAKQIHVATARVVKMLNGIKKEK